MYTLEYLAQPVKPVPVKMWNMSEIPVYMSLYMCQDGGLQPLCSRDVFHTACSCESAIFNKQSLPLSKPLSQTNSMIKRHTWGEPKGNLPCRFHFSAVPSLFISPLSCLFRFPVCLEGLWCFGPHFHALDLTSTIPLPNRILVM